MVGSLLGGLDLQADVQSNPCRQVKSLMLNDDWLISSIVSLVKFDQRDDNGLLPHWDSLLSLSYSGLTVTSTTGKISKLRNMKNAQ